MILVFVVRWFPALKMVFAFSPLIVQKDWSLKLCLPPSVFRKLRGPNERFRTRFLFRVTFWLDRNMLKTKSFGNDSMSLMRIDFFTWRQRGLGIGLFLPLLRLVITWSPGF